MICRFWCKAHKETHFIHSAGDDLDTAPCLELGNWPSCESIRTLGVIGILVTEPSVDIPLESSKIEKVSLDSLQGDSKP